MIPTLIFSRDRPFQLDALLGSMDEFAPELFAPTALYRATSEAFAEGYAICAGEHPTVVYEPQANFEAQVHGHLDSLGRLAFFTDDDLLYRPLPELPSLEERNLLCLTLRLGENTDYCYPLARSQAVPGLRTVGDWRRWHWYNCQFDWGYPMSLDGTIFKTDSLRQILGSARFSNPNTLEQALTDRVLPDHGAEALCPAQSCVVSLPLNIVSQTHRNRVADAPWLLAERLNACYLAGERMDRAGMNFSDVHAAHQEIRPAFKWRTHCGQAA